MKSKIKYNQFTKYLHPELIGFIVLFIIILINAVIFNDSHIAVVYASCGILYTMLAGKGKIKCYTFGIIATLCYSYLAYKNSLFGNMALNLCYYLPMQILGIFSWKKHLNKDLNEIIKTKLNIPDRIILSILTLISSIFTIILLLHLNDKSAVIDGLTTVLSIAAMYLTVKRCIEQWILWTIINFLSIIMWVKISLSGVRVYSTILVWSVYFILGIYFYIKWKNEIKN